MMPANPSRRRFLKGSMGTVAAGLCAGLPKGWAGGAYADDSPETPNLRIGIMGLTDCASIVMAHELGYFREFGIRSVLSREPSWVALRDKLSRGENHASQMLFGMPYASTMGLAGCPVKPMVYSWLLNRNGQGITLSNKLGRAGVRTVGDLEPVVHRAKATGETMTFAMTFSPGTHAMWLRYWLASGGIHPDIDINLLTISAPQMIANMKIDRMDGFCVGEPWNARAVIDRTGFTAITSQQIWKDHPEDVCAFTETFANKNPRTMRAVVKALHRASSFVDRPENRRVVAEVLSRPAYVNCSADIILDRMQGIYDYGDGRREQRHDYVIFSERGCNFPQKTFGLWWLSQFRRWGMVGSAPDYPGIVQRVVRQDVFYDAMKDMGVTKTFADMQKQTLMDGTFDPTDPEGYALSFPIHSRDAAGLL